MANSMDERRPRALLLSKRANVFYLERCRVQQHNECVVYLTETGEPISQMFNIPDKNTLFLLLGTGTSITNSAMRKLSESNVIVGFCGTGGSPLIASTDITFIVPQNEYRPTEYAQKWFSIFQNDDSRIDLGKKLIRTRMEWTQKAWSKAHKIKLDEDFLSDIKLRVDSAKTTTEILSAEGLWAKFLYKSLASRHEITFSRKEGQGKTGDRSQRVNRLLDHGNYLAYGYAAVALNGLGIPFSLPILHGKTRRGGLVFDVADLIKDQAIMPHCFEVEESYKDIREADKAMRSKVIDYIDKNRTLDQLFNTLKQFASGADARKGD